MKNKLLLIVITITTFVAAMFPIGVAAQSRPNIEDRQAKREELRNANVEKRCTIVTSNITKLTNRYDVIHPAHVARYQKLAENLKQADERLTQLGFDTNQVKTKLVELDAMVVKLSGMIKQLDLLLEESKTLACGESEVAYKAKVEEARNQMKLIRDYAQDIKKFVNSDVRPAMQELRSQRGSN
jgi:hypothetical protein